MSGLVRQKLWWAHNAWTSWTLGLFISFAHAKFFLTHALLLSSLILVRRWEYIYFFRPRTWKDCSVDGTCMTFKAEMRRHSLSYHGWIKWASFQNLLFESWCWFVQLATVVNRVGRCHICHAFQVVGQQMITSGDHLLLSINGGSARSDIFDCC